MIILKSLFMKTRLENIYRKLKTMRLSGASSPDATHLKTEHRARETGHGTLNPKLPDWWPAETPFEVMVGAILTQNTNWRNVEKAIINLKEANTLDPQTILETPNIRLEMLVRSSGFYRQKAERLKSATHMWVELQNKKMGTIALRNRWLSVKGIGKETADSICLYAFNRPIFVIDAYTRRFCDHHKLFHAKEYDDYRLFFESNLPRSVPLYKEYHALIVEWGKRNPRLKARD